MPSSTMCSACSPVLPEVLNAEAMFRRGTQRGQSEGVAFRGINVALRHLKCYSPCWKPPLIALISCARR
eukprot:1270480-Pyramimonas_sp.AAC.1